MPCSANTKLSATSEIIQLATVPVFTDFLQVFTSQWPQIGSFLTFGCEANILQMSRHSNSNVKVIYRSNRPVVQRQHSIWNATTTCYLFHLLKQGLKFKFKASPMTKYPNETMRLKLLHISHTNDAQAFLGGGHSRPFTIMMR